MAHIPQENATHTYLLDEPFAAALKRVRRALKSSQLVITLELDLAARIRKALLISVPPCVVLFASCSSWTAQDFVLDLTAAALTPLHIVVSARGARTEVHFLRSQPALVEPSEHTGLAKLASLQAAISYALEGIGMRSLDA
jgi:uncharacterized protein (DUF302 family)